MIFHTRKGVIALDIDGTITSEMHALHQDVIQYLSNLSREGWTFIFLTGRPFQWGFEVLKHFTFPYFFAVQNGATTLEMPGRHVIDHCYLKRDILPRMETICHALHTDFVIYAGFEYNDFCYYRPKYFKPELLAYIQRRAAILQEKWVAVDSFDHLDAKTFASLKCFAQGESAFILSRQIEEQLHLHAPPNRDPFNEAYFVVQATHPEANKGESLHRFIQLTEHPRFIIAAGDDLNDVTMLKQADIKIVMADAPEALKVMADIVAPVAEEQGIIQGLKEAMKRIESKREEPHA